MVYGNKFEKNIALVLAAIAVCVALFFFYGLYTDSRVERDSRDIKTDLEQVEASSRRTADRLDDASDKINQTGNELRDAKRRAAEIGRESQDLAKSAEDSRREIGECLGILDRCESRNRELAEILDGLEKGSAGPGTQAQSRTPTA